MRTITGPLALICAGLFVAGPTALHAQASGAIVDLTPAQRYVVTLDEPPLIERLVSLEQSLQERREAAVLRDADGKLDLRSDRARAELREIETAFAEVLGEVKAETGLDLDLLHRYQLATNGFVVELTESQARELEAAPGIRSVHRDEKFSPDTDAGPRWIGAERVWNAEVGSSENRGEGIIIGIIDSGANWDHPSFFDPGEGGGPGWDHENPLGEQLGLCSDPEVLCNDKLIGVYDFVQDVLSTEFEEDFNNGRDNGDHGAHVAGTAGGNPVTYEIIGEQVTVSGVAPNANLISYRICHRDNPDAPNDGTCFNSWSLAAIEQALEDGVDVINYSIGGPTPTDPWFDNTARAYLNMREAGVFVATSAGNSGPGRATVGSPANAPWVVSVGASTHDRYIGGELELTAGGAGAPPQDLFGQTLTDLDLLDREIVYAGDFGNALCAVGEPEDTPTAACDEFTGATNPFPPGTFNGEIVVCDRGGYARVEKGRNLQLAGAGGYVLVNKRGGLTSVVADQHCLPAVHLDSNDGDALLAWLEGGDGHRGSLLKQALRSNSDGADVMASFTSRGPNAAPVDDVLKPDISAPGVSILAADNVSTGLAEKQGTSMASPHIAGAAALVLAARPELTPAQVASILMLTSTAEGLQNWNDGPVSPFDYGAGRVRVDEAIDQVLYLDEDPAAFRAADPRRGGSPQDLNLASLTNASCGTSCEFTRTIGALEDSGEWVVSVDAVPAGAQVTVTPDRFSLAAGETQELRVQVSLAGIAPATWVSTRIKLDNPSFPPAAMPLSARTESLPLPSEFVIETDRSSGFQDFDIGSLPEIFGADFITGGLAAPLVTNLSIAQDTTPASAFDGGTGVALTLFEVPQDTLVFEVRTLTSDAEDVELYVGIDRNGDGEAERGEIVCERTGPSNRELCEIDSPEAGTWWVVVQNSEDGAPGSSGSAQSIPLQTTTILGGASASLTATGPGLASADSAVKLRLSWQDVNAAPGTELIGAVRIVPFPLLSPAATTIPVRLNRTGVDIAPSRPLLDGREAGFALPAGAAHEALYIDVPPGVDALVVEAQGDSGQQNDQLAIDLVRVPFDDAFAAAPGVVSAAGRTPAVSTTGSGGAGPVALIEGGVTPGRWYLVVRNSGTGVTPVRVTAELSHGASPIELPGGLWSPSSRPGIGQGFEYTAAGNNRAMVWYTYDEDGLPTWYIASGPIAEGNSWSADLLRFTNEGFNQKFVSVGEVGITLLDTNDAVFSWTLFGVSGSDRVSGLQRACPDAISPPQNFSGLWYRGSDGIGGASVYVTRQDQSQIHYLFDGRGEPRWLLAAGAFTADSLPLNQWEGFCPTCTGSTSFQQVGEIEVGYDDNSSGFWDIDYEFMAPLTGERDGDDGIVRLTDELSCPG